jgi:arginase
MRRAVKVSTGTFPALAASIKPQNVCMMGIRSVDPEERAAVRAAGVTIHDMRAIDENGIVPLLDAFLKRVAAADGVIHVSLDVDFLDPGIAPGVGTTVPGGATFREAHLIMEVLHDSGLVGSLDLVELNPFLDERGRTALLMVDLVASLMGHAFSTAQPRVTATPPRTVEHPWKGQPSTLERTFGLSPGQTSLRSSRSFRSFRFCDVSCPRA